MHLPYQKVKKNILWGRYYTGTIDIIPLYRQLTFFLLNQFIFCKEEVVATYA